MMKNKFSVDVIIAAYNAHDTIVKTLSSLSIQIINFPLNVIIVNDGSDYDYQKEISFFKESLNIKEVKNCKNKGAGISKQKGLDSGNGDFILFLDSDDVLFDSHALQTLYNLVSDGKCDYAYGALIFEEKNTKNILEFHDGCLHGKIYSRKLINDNSIKFNTTRTSEDNSFNHLCLFNSSNIRSTKDIVYVYKYNTFSLTKNLDIVKQTDNLIDYINNILYTINNFDDIKNVAFLKYYIHSITYASNRIDRIKSINYNQGLRAEKVLIELRNKTSFYSQTLLDKIINMMESNLV